MTELTMHKEVREVWVLSDGRAYITKEEAEGQIEIRNKLIAFKEEHK